MKTGFYADIRGGSNFPHGGKGTYGLLGSLMSRLHSFNSGVEPNLRLAAFPLALPVVSGAYAPDVGLRIIGSEDSVESLLEDLFPDMPLGERSSVRKPHCRAVPVANTQIAWIRTRDNDRLTVGYHERRLRREMARYIKRGGEGRRPADTAVRISGVSQPEENGTHYVNISSSSNGSAFRLGFRFIQSENRNLSNEGAVGTYGFSSIDKPFWIPNFV